MKINKDIKTYIETTLNEEKLWKVGESDTFNIGKWECTLRKEEEIYKPFIYSVKGTHENGSVITRRYTSMDKAFLSCQPGRKNSTSIALAISIGSSESSFGKLSNEENS